MVEFNRDWYEKLISRSNEKGLLVQKISDLIGSKKQNCLEIGLGTSAYFSEKLSGKFDKYTIIEKENFTGKLKPNTNFIQGDFEKHEFKEKFDIIIASHVIYYFEDLEETIKKMLNLLNDNGEIFFVVNGSESDYGLIKYAFSNMINESYKFTYDILKSHLKNQKVTEYTIASNLGFESYEDLYETLKLSFDLYPKEYIENKDKVINWLKENIKGDKFFIDQKIIKVTK